MRRGARRAVFPVAFFGRAGGNVSGSTHLTIAGPVRDPQHEQAWGASRVTRTRRAKLSRRQEPVRRATRARFASAVRTTITPMIVDPLEPRRLLTAAVSAGQLDPAFGTG